MAVAVAVVVVQDPDLLNRINLLTLLGRLMVAIVLVQIRDTDAAQSIGKSIGIRLVANDSRLGSWGYSYRDVVLFPLLVAVASRTPG